MSAPRLTPDPDWFDFVREGDVIQLFGGYRVVRKVTRWQRVRRGMVDRTSGPLRYLTFTIKRRSWTGRSYTCYAASELKTLGAKYIGVRIPLTGEMDQRIAHCIGANEWPGHYSLTPEDVRGVA